jgi:transcriptional regulator with XRE-family HTH domain
MSIASADIVSVVITPPQCRMARAALQWSLKDLAERSRVNHVTINRFETGQAASNPSTRMALRIALEAAGVVFIAENGGGAGVRLRKEVLA